MRGAHNGTEANNYQCQPLLLFRASSCWQHASGHSTHHPPTPRHTLSSRQIFPCHPEHADSSPVPFPVILSGQSECKGDAKGWLQLSFAAAHPSCWGCRQWSPVLGSSMAKAVRRHQDGSTQLVAHVGENTLALASLQPGTGHLQPTEQAAAMLPPGFLKLGQRKESFLLKLQCPEPSRSSPRTYWAVMLTWDQCPAQSCAPLLPSASLRVPGQQAQGTEQTSLPTPAPGLHFCIALSGEHRIQGMCDEK